MGQPNSHFELVRPLDVASLKRWRHRVRKGKSVPQLGVNGPVSFCRISRLPQRHVHIAAAHNDRGANFRAGEIVRNDFGIRDKLNLQHLEEDDVRTFSQLFSNQTERDRLVAG